ncbi:uncharacterized protein LOC113327697 [Papaver somniferum]|uniref:uncharacterized protein LOC113327697 n=1 Tax=Papaver somniferum TaxID=3469 RepID=UPI000E702B8A|nr:uncharacterized protein LOC113327697 [Papaver somniferum]XP_026430627.1 uncharacterized protein LOC113327697 [Papaver somniferum]
MFSIMILILVYTLGSGIGWRNAKKKMAYDVNGLYVSHHRSGVFANGAIHWVDDRGIVVAFILADEEFRERPSPLCSRQIGNLRPILELHVFDDYLCVYVCQQDRGFDIWVLKKNQNYHDVCIWSKGFSNLPWYNLPITFTMSGRLLCHDARDKNVYHYAPEASSSRCFVNFGKNFEIGIPHKNTLVSLKALGEEETKLMDSGERARSSGGQKTVISQKEQKEETNI